MSPRTWADVGIEIPFGRFGEVDTTCPQCSPTRKKRTARCLSVNTDLGTWFCHHCSWAGALGLDGAGYGAPLRHRMASPAPPRVYTTPKPPPSGALPPHIVDWFAGRAIPASVLSTAGISAGQEWCPACGRSVLAIRFPYLRDRALINIKYRCLEKHFWMVKGARRIVYGEDTILGAEMIALVEGEIDALSVRVVGGPPTLSVPDGAPPPDAKHYASKFSFLDAPAMERLTAARTVVIGTDMDAPGARLAEELAQRIGRGRCCRASWLPYKDVNEMLVAQGPQAVLNALATAQPFPVPVDDAVPHGTRPVRLLPPVHGRRSVIDLSGTEARHAS